VVQAKAPHPATGQAPRAAREVAPVEREAADAQAVQRLVTVKGAYDRQRTDGNERDLRLEVDDTIRSGDIDNIKRTIAQLELSINNRTNNPNMDEGHEHRVTVERELRKDLQEAFLRIDPPKIFVEKRKKDPKPKKNPRATASTASRLTSEQGGPPLVCSSFLCADILGVDRPYAFPLAGVPVRWPPGDCCEVRLIPRLLAPGISGHALSSAVDGGRRSLAKRAPGFMGTHDGERIRASGRRLGCGSGPLGSNQGRLGPWSFSTS
jgi:hypothetical protein